MRMRNHVLVLGTLLVGGCSSAPCPDAPVSTPCPECGTVATAKPDPKPDAAAKTVPVGHEPVELKVKVPDVSLQAAPGQRVFAPYRAAFLTRADSFDLDLVMHAGVMRVVGDTQSLIENDTMSVGSIPNVFIVPVPDDERAKPGDLIMRHDGRARMGDERAQVVAGGTEAAPMARELSTWKVQDPEEVAAGTFVVLRPWGPGTHLACKRDGDLDDVVVVRVVGEKVIGLGWAGRLRFDDKVNCVPVPIAPKLKVGQAVKIAVVTDYHPGTVVSIDENAGYAEVSYEWGGSPSSNKVLFGEILTSP